MIETIDTLAEGTVTAERGPLTYTAKWRVKGNTLIVFFGADQDLAGWLVAIQRSREPVAQRR